MPLYDVSVMRADSSPMARTVVQAGNGADAARQCFGMFPDTHNNVVSATPVAVDAQTASSILTIGTSIRLGL